MCQVGLSGCVCSAVCLSCLWCRLFLFVICKITALASNVVLKNEEKIVKNNTGNAKPSVGLLCCASKEVVVTLGLLGLLVPPVRLRQWSRCYSSISPFACVSTVSAF